MAKMRRVMIAVAAVAATAACLTSSSVLITLLLVTVVMTMTVPVVPSSELLSAALKGYLKLFSQNFLFGAYVHPARVLRVEPAPTTHRSSSSSSKNNHGTHKLSPWHSTPRCCQKCSEILEGVGGDSNKEARSSNEGKKTFFFFFVVGTAANNK